VGDDYLNEVLEYPAGVQNPAPKGSISLPATPTGLAEDINGNLYVAVGNDQMPGVVDIFNSSGKLIRQLNGANGLGCGAVTGLTFDSADSLYVAQSCNGAAEVLEFAPGVASGQPEYTYNVPTEVAGVATDAQRDLYVAAVLVAYEFPQLSEQSTRILTGGGGLAYGVAILLNGDLAVGGSHYLTTYAPPNFTEVSQINYGTSSGGVYEIATATDGTLYVPTNTDNGQNSNGTVWVYPPAPMAPYTITNGLSEPFCVTAGK
jgi:hypothetical protein